MSTSVSLPAEWSPASPKLTVLNSRSSRIGVEKLSSTAKEFESILLSQWLQSAEDSFATVPGTDTEEDQGAEQLRSFGVQNLAKALSESGGIGLGAMVLKTLKRVNEEAHARENSMDGIDSHT